MPLHVRVTGTPTGRCWFGGKKRLSRSPPSKLYAFAVLHTGEPNVLEYEDTHDGCEDLAALLRTGDVMSLIRGEVVDFSVESVVSLARSGGSFESRVHLTRSI